MPGYNTFSFVPRAPNEQKNRSKKLTKQRRVRVVSSDSPKISDLRVPAPAKAKEVTNMYQQQKEISRAIKDYEANKPPPPPSNIDRLQSISNDIANYEALDKAKSMNLKAMALAQSLTQKSRAFAPNKNNPRNAAILGDKEHQDRISKLAKELSKERKQASENMRKRQQDAIDAIRRKRQQMEHSKRVQSLKATPSRESTEKMRLANERRYLKVKMEELEKVKKKTSSDTLKKRLASYERDQTRFLKDDVTERELRDFERKKQEKAAEAHRQMRQRQAEHLKKLEKERKKKNRQQKNKLKAQKNWLKSIKKEVMSDVKDFLKEEQQKKEFKSLYGESNDNLLWFDPEPKTTPRAPPRPPSQSGEELKVETVVNEADKKMFGRPWNSRIAMVLATEAEEGDPYYGLQRLIFKEQNWRRSIRRYTSAGISRRKKQEKKAMEKKSNAWWTKSKLGI
eukprot:g1203.t1